MTGNKRLYCLILVLMTSVLGFFVGYISPQKLPHIQSLILGSNITDHVIWPKHFSQIDIPGNREETYQAAYFLKAPNGPPQPLVVSLHSWSADYTQFDALAPLVENEGWNYIHPDFQGPNSTTEACLSEMALNDIDNAIQYAINYGNVDLKNIFVVGTSGGGYATLGAYLKTRHHVRAFLAWSPISDLYSWFYQVSYHNPKYSKDILTCTGSLGESLNETKAKQRSPLFWTIPEKLPQRLEIYSGLDDGYSGAVPISQSISFYNRIAEKLGYYTNIVTSHDIIRLLTRGIDRNTFVGSLGERGIFYKQDITSLSLVIFNGGHEMLPSYCIDRIKTLVLSQPTRR